MGHPGQRGHAAADPGLPGAAGLRRVAGPLADGRPTWPPPRRAKPSGAWGRLGYPRRAIRLHLTARALVDRHEGQVPVSLEALRALPGIGAYTAAAVASFAFGQRHAVLDTNVRRVLGRVADGRELPPPSPSVAERRLAESLLPETPAVAARWSVAVMELGALVCTAARPGCPRCPVADQCAWRRAGHPPGDGPRRSPGYEGTDRQCRGRLLAVLRDTCAPVSAPALDAAWPDASQRARALDGLVADGLVDPLPDGTYALPGLHAAGGGRAVRAEPYPIRRAEAANRAGRDARIPAPTTASQRARHGRRPSTDPLHRAPTTASQRARHGRRPWLSKKRGGPRRARPATYRDRAGFSPAAGRWPPARPQHHCRPLQAAHPERRPAWPRP